MKARNKRLFITAIAAAIAVIAVVIIAREPSEIPTAVDGLICRLAALAVLILSLWVIGRENPALFDDQNNNI